jgi:hypothetical protein
MGIIPLKLEIGGQFSPELPQPRKQGLMTGFLFQLESALVSHQYLYVVTFVKFQRFDDRSGYANRQAVAPF